MKEDNLYNVAMYYRLVALWVTCEAFAGGLMHAAKIPLTGMVVSSLAVSCIMLIAYFVPSSTAILKATITVAFFKLLLSPHSPPTAYIAVFFQGYLGHLLFNYRKHFLISAIAVAVLALVESALQRLLVLLVIYGNSFWEAFDIYLQRIIGGSFSNYTLAAALTYILFHAIIGFFVALSMTKLLRKTGDKKLIKPFLVSYTSMKIPVEDIPGKKRKFVHHFFWIAWIVIFIFYLQAILDPGDAVLPLNGIILIVVRAVLILLTWYLLLAPLAMTLIKRWLTNKERQRHLPILEIQQLLPEIRQLLVTSWQLSATNTGFTRIKFFMQILFINIVHAESRIESIK